jgi:hypothetical protein
MLGSFNIDQVVQSGLLQNLSIAFHPQIDGKSKKKIKTLDDLLRACVLGFEGNWEDQFPLCRVYLQ